MILTEKALKEIRHNSKLRMKLAIELDRTDFTILRWLESNNDNLTKASAIAIIKEETGLEESEILTEEVEATDLKTGA